MRLTPFVRLAENLGSFAGQLTESTILGVTIEYAGDVAEMNTRALTAALLAGLLRPILTEVNMVNAPVVARERGIAVDETRQTQRGAYETYIRLTVRTERQERSVAGTVFSDGRPRVIQIKGINMESGFAPNLLYITNSDRPGFIGRLGTLLGNAKVNIANFNLGRVAAGEDAISLIEVDEPITDAVLDQVEGPRRRGAGEAAELLVRAPRGPVTGRLPRTKQASRPAGATGRRDAGRAP